MKCTSMAVFRTGPFLGGDFALVMCLLTWQVYFQCAFMAPLGLNLFFLGGGGNECGALIYSSSSTPLGGNTGPKKDQILFLWDEGMMDVSAAHWEGMLTWKGCQSRTGKRCCFYLMLVLESPGLSHDLGPQCLILKMLVYFGSREGSLCWG